MRKIKQKGGNSVEGTPPKGVVGRCARDQPLFCVQGSYPMIRHIRRLVNHNNITTVSLAVANNCKEDSNGPSKNVATTILIDLRLQLARKYSKCVMLECCLLGIGGGGNFSNNRNGLFVR